MTIIGLDGRKLIDDSPLAIAKRHVKWIIPLFEKLQTEAYKRRSVFGPFELATLKEGEYTIEYSFEENEQTPQVMAVFYGDSIFGEDFMEYLFNCIEQRNMQALVEAMEQSYLMEQEDEQND